MAGGGWTRETKRNLYYALSLSLFRLQHRHTFQNHVPHDSQATSADFVIRSFGAGQYPPEFTRSLTSAEGTPRCRKETCSSSTGIVSSRKMLLYASRFAVAQIKFSSAGVEY